MDDDVRRTPTRRHLLTVAAAGVAAVALIALGALWHRGERALLEVTAVTGEVTCRGATPRLVESPFDDFPLLLGTRDSACEEGRTSRSTEVRS